MLFPMRIQLFRLIPFALLLILSRSFCAGFTPFKNRGAGNSLGTVMVNTANTVPNISNNVHGQSQSQGQSHSHSPANAHGHGHGHGHGNGYAQHSVRPPAAYIFGDKYHLYHTVNYNHHPHHSHHQSLHVQTNKRQIRNPLEIVYEWRQLDFEYPTFLERQRAILSGEFVPSNNLPLGVDRWRNRLFVTMPRWKNGVPASLATLPLPAIERSPQMRPYPSWDWHANPEAVQPDCSRLMSVYRIWIDECERLWILDAGIVNATIQMNAVCPPKIIAFDLRTDQPLFSYELPIDQVKEDSLHSNLIVDIRNGRCQDAHAYITDVWRFGLVVFSLAKGRSWRTTNHFYMPDPDACDYTLNNINFQWVDGVFGLSLSPLNELQDRLLFFHPMSSFGEFMVSTSVLRNETAWSVNNGFGLAGAFVQIGDRGVRGQSSTAGIDRNKVQFFNLVQQNAVGCWNIDQPYYQNTIDIVAQDNTTLVFPNDLKIDQEPDQNLWVLSNRLPVYLYAQLDFTDINFRIQRANVREAVMGTACDPTAFRRSTVLVPGIN